MSENQLTTTNNSIVMPAVNAEQAIEAWRQYQDLKKAIIDKDVDVQLIEGKEFLKKSYWRKVATFFNLSVDIVDEKHEQIGKTIVWHFTAKATAPNGRSAIGVGSCDVFEKADLVDGKYVKKKVVKWGKKANGKSFPVEFEMVPASPNSLHNTRSTAETRAFNRAISNLVGGGEVSAEEVNVNTNYDRSPYENTRTITPEQRAKVLNLLTEKKKTMDDLTSFVKKAFNLNEWDKLSFTQANSLIKKLESLSEKEQVEEYLDNGGSAEDLPKTKEDLDLDAIDEGIEKMKKEKSN